MFLLTEIAPTVIFMLNTRKRSGNPEFAHDSNSNRVAFKKSNNK